MSPIAKNPDFSLKIALSAKAVVLSVLLILIDCAAGFSLKKHILRPYQSYFFHRFGFGRSAWVKKFFISPEAGFAAVVRWKSFAGNSQSRMYP